MNQFGRRNLFSGTRSILALKLEPILKAKADTKAEESRKEFHGNQHVSGMVPTSAPQQEEKRKTRDELAKIAGVGHDTIL